ncbi:uncharacterized protein LOC116177793 [Photinus pyralis]|uniref:uncharacterized protein LOC116177793 n=1 Tax=Photinus pyralis TaxID=7054 RepID=UPI00126778EE|nr:uncharacterized protein LOC116177793 [Photinus pyralis]
MASRPNRLVFLLVLGLSLLHFASPLKCYTCNSANSNLCNDPFVNDTVEAVRCALVTHVCVKHVIPNEGVSRGCSTKDYCRIYNGSNRCHTCSDDYCNSGLNQISSVAVVGLAVFHQFIAILC